MKRSYKPYIISLLHNIMDLQHIQPKSIITLSKFVDKKTVILLVEFGDNEEVHEILSKVITLNGTNITIEKDLSAEERTRKSALLNIRREVLKRTSESNISMKVVLSEKKIKFNNDVFLFDKTRNIFIASLEEDEEVCLNNYIFDKFNLIVDANYCIRQQ